MVGANTEPVTVAYPNCFGNGSYWWVLASACELKLWLLLDGMVSMALETGLEAFLPRRLVRTQAHKWAWAATVV